MADWFDENDPEKQDWFTANSPSPTAAELSTLEAPEGSPQRQDINRSVAGSLFETPGKYARDPTLAELIDASMPRSVQEAKLREKGIPMAPPLPEQGAFEQGGIYGVTMPAVEAGVELGGAMIPHNWQEYLEQIYAPATAFRVGRNLAQGEVGDIPLVGRIPEIMEADETPAFSKERYLTTAKTLMDLGALAGASVKDPRVPLRAEPTLAERITQPRPEAADMLRETLPDAETQAIFDQKLAEAQGAPEPPVAEPQMPVNAPEAVVPSPVAEAAPPAPAPVSPGAAKQLGKLKAYVEKSKKLNQNVDPDVVKKIAEIEGVPPEAPVQAQEGPSFASEAPGGVPGAETPAGVVEPPPPGIGAITETNMGGLQSTVKVGDNPIHVLIGPRGEIDFNVEGAATYKKTGVGAFKTMNAIKPTIQEMMRQMLKKNPEQTFFWKGQSGRSTLYKRSLAQVGIEAKPFKPFSVPKELLETEPPPPGAGAPPHDVKYPKLSSDTVSGMRVRREIPNQGSISAELGQDYEVLPGIREMKMSDFPGITGKSYSKELNAKIARLSEEIGQSGEINPLIVVDDASGQGPYILEGASRIDALKRLGKETFPAQVVIDTSEAGGKAPPPEVPPSERGYAGMEPIPPVAKDVKGDTGEGGIAIKNEYTDAKRQELGFPEAVKEASRDFGSVWEEAEATHRRDPGAGSRLVEDINKGKVKALDDHGDALLLREQIRAQGEHSDAVKAVNEAVTDADKTVAKARLQVARDELQAVYDADKKAGRSTAQGLNARKLLAKEDYSLTQMEARKRAANNGERLSEGQLKEVEALHATIADLTARMDAMDRQRFGFRDAGKEATAARKSGKRLTDYTGEAAKKARERIQRQLHGLGAKPAPPTLLYDYAVVGADHLARGLTKFSDWSAQMLKEFGEKVKPHLQDLWKMARAVHDKTAKAFRTPEEVRLERYKTRLAQDTAGVTAKIQRGDFTKQVKQRIVLDKAAYKMKGNLQRLKNEFERGVAKDAYRKMSKADKFWQHFIGVERNVGKLSSPAVFQKLGLAAMVREVLAPIEAGGGYAVSKVFPRLAKGTRYGGDLKTVARAEIKAKAAFFTEGMKDSWENLKGKETSLEALSDKYGRQPNFWYNRIGKIHAAVKAPVKRAEFVRSLETRMDAAVKVGENINHPEVMDRLANEAALDANRAIFQQNTVVSKFFSQLDRLHPAGGRTARFLFPVVKIPVNLFKELLTYNFGAPAAVLKIGHAYWKGIETLPPLQREAIIRQLVKGSAGGAAILWGYYNSEKVHDFFKSVPTFFQHTPIAMAIHEGSLIKQLEEQGSGTYYKPSEAQKEAAFAAKSSIPFMYTLTDAMDAITKPGGTKKWFYNMVHSTVVPQAVSWTAKELDKPTPFSIFDKTPYRKPRNVVEAVTQGIPGLREDIPAKEFKEKKEPSVTQRLKAKKAAETRARNKAREED